MKRKTHAEFLEEISDRPLAALEEYRTNRTKIKFMCCVCKHEWSANPNKILSGRGCPPCSRKAGAEKRAGTNEVLEDHGSWLLVDISTPRHIVSAMAVDRDVFDRHVGGRIYAVASGRSKYIYAQFSLGTKTRKFHHHVIQMRVGFEIDHITHGSMHFIDNRRQNLRLVSSTQNKQNCALSGNNTSGVTGVTWSSERKLWVAQIGVAYKCIPLGRFANLEDAAKARRDAEEKYFGEYAFVANNDGVE